MLFGYPYEATKGNWLHVCLCVMLRAVHRCTDEGRPVLPWPELIPVAYRERLKARTGLRDRLQTYSSAIADLPPADRSAVCGAFRSQNRIRKLLENGCTCATASELPVAVRGPLSELFREAFRLLGEYGLRDEQYSSIYRALKHSVCPFCGLEHFDAPGAPREDFDHYLPISRYPFAGANGKNLVPMGSRCNSQYKGTADILWDGLSRRRAFFPYDHPTVTVTLAGSQPFGAGHDGEPDWQVALVPATEEASTWDAVFHVRERYVRDVLKPSYKSWLGEFRSFCRSWGHVPADLPELITSLERFRDFKRAEGLRDLSFLKAEVFDVLVAHCRAGNGRLIGLLQDVAGLE